jgi:hypothetical protein
MAQVEQRVEPAQRETARRKAHLLKTLTAVIHDHAARKVRRAATHAGEALRLVEVRDVRLLQRRRRRRGVHLIEQLDLRRLGRQCASQIVLLGSHRQRILSQVKMGSQKPKVLPCPSLLTNQTCPPCRSITSLTKLKPMPLPLICRVAACVARKCGWKIAAC